MLPPRLASSSTASVGASRRGEFFFGPWADVEHAHAMLAKIRSAMEQEFAEFFETGAGGENPKTSAASFSEGMGRRICQRLHQLKAGRPTNVMARGKDLVAAFGKLFPGDLGTELGHRSVRLPIPPASRLVIASSFVGVDHRVATAAESRSRTGD